MARRRCTCPSTICRLLSDVVTLVCLAVTPRARLAAENLFRRKQLALYHERGVKPRRSDPETRAVLVLLSRLVDWMSILTVVKPDTLIRWPGDRVDGAACAQDARADTAGQCVLRTSDRDAASGVSGLADPHSRGTSPLGPSRMDDPLQSRSPTRQPRTRHSTAGAGRGSGHVHRHRLPAHTEVIATPILGGLHHEYRLTRRAA